MKIGSVNTNNILLAPLAGITDRAFRTLCKEQGCGMTYTEMVSAKGIIYNNENTKALLEVSENENPVGVQLFGSDPEIIAEAIRRIEHMPFDVIDINMGCPVPKIVKNGEGSALMKNPELISKIIKSAAAATIKPVTLKIRKGFSENLVNAVEIAKIAEQSGAAAIAVHGRTREQFYSGNADWNIISEVKRAVRIPVIGNGDVFCEEDAHNMLGKTGCDGVMVARGAIGNPWIFGKIQRYLETGEQNPPVSMNEKISMCLRHLRLAMKFGESEAYTVRGMRKHLCWYIKGIPNSANAKILINRAETIAEIDEILNSL